MKVAVSPKMRRAGSAREAIEGADIVVTGTAIFKERNPLVRKEWVKPGALIAPLEVDRALDAALVYDADLLVVDDRAQTLAFQDMGCFSEGPPTIHAELGEIVSGKKPGRKNETDIIISMNVGLSVEDIGVGHHVYQNAIKSGFGQRIIYS
jgi:ornithine cyclodeaminase/alanine dehydrogenase-like protein (mu-crystallin family)